jgi:hypothetical protein
VFPLAVDKTAGEKIVSTFCRIVNLSLKDLFKQNYCQDYLWKTHQNSVENSGKSCIETQEDRGKVV